MVVCWCCVVVTSVFSVWFCALGNKKVNEDEVAVDDVNTEMLADSRSSQSKISFWRSIWKRDTFPRLVPAFGLIGKAVVSHPNCLMTSINFMAVKDLYVTTTYFRNTEESKCCIIIDKCIVLH